MMERGGTDKLPEKFREEYKLKLLDSAQKRIGVAALKELDAKGVEEFTKLTQAEGELKPDALLDFFRTRIPDFNKKMTQTLEEFADDFIKGAEKIRKQKLA
ncbi:MAG: hypothetical protein KJ893_05245 [Candidatus Omnitrophica bacterium]|nr:hypothetical protein [Candidatus Omnitrophota bacterium]